MFEQFQITLQRWLVSSMVPESIAKPVLLNLNQFVSKTSQMGMAGGVFFVVTALALILTIDRKLNDIWRVRRPRGVTQRVLVYWAVLTLGPLVLALSLTLTAYAVGDQRALIKGLSVGTRFWLESLEWVLVVGGIAALYRYVPNTTGFFDWDGMQQGSLGVGVRGNKWFLDAAWQATYRRAQYTSAQWDGAWNLPMVATRAMLTLGYRIR